MLDVSIPAFYILPLALAVLYVIRGKRSSLPLPPGPRGLPLVGNLLDWPFEAGWLKFAEWGKIFAGDIVHIEIFGMHIVILNSYEAAQRLMSQALCSDRPPLAMVGELMGFNPSMVLSPYGEHWKAMRRATQQSFSRTASAKLLPRQLKVARMLLQQLLKTPREHVKCIRFALGKNLIETTYGIPIETPQSEFFKLSREMHEVIQNAVVPGSFLVDVFPVLKHVPSWFPGAGFKRLALIARSLQERVVEGAFSESKKLSVCGSLMFLDNTTHFSQAQGNAIESVRICTWSSFNYHGSCLTCRVQTLSALSTFVLMMAMHRDIQSKAQAELDRVVGTNRLPTFEDRKSLPYLEAIVKEVLRFNPPTPLGIAHRLSEDDSYSGYHLPKGSIVLSNIWAMSRSPHLYNDPSSFNPERYSTENGTPELDPTALVFGFGRRACLGTHYSLATLFIAMTSILTVFDIRARDENGADVEIVADFTGGMC
ncbi:cytochrome P450 [Amylostereum chailletii]|nr:cytochrome P450 [Amylostereum chailletii]